MNGHHRQCTVTFYLRTMTSLPLWPRLSASPQPLPFPFPQFAPSSLSSHPHPPSVARLAGVANLSWPLCALIRPGNMQLLGCSPGIHMACARSGVWQWRKPTNVLFTHESPGVLGEESSEALLDTCICALWSVISVFAILVFSLANLSS